RAGTDRRGRPRPGVRRDPLPDDAALRAHLRPRVARRAPARRRPRLGRRRDPPPPRGGRGAAHRLETARYGDVVDVTDRTFESEVLDRSKREPVVVDFWADWCGPCKTLAPVLEQAAAEHGVTLAKLDVDANQLVAEEYGIRGIPAVKAFRNGHVVAEFVGAQPKASVEAFLAELTKPSVSETVEDPDLRRALDAGDYARALELLLGRVADDPDGARETMVALFAELGAEHPLSAEYRRKLAAALY